MKQTLKYFFIAITLFSLSCNVLFAFTFPADSMGLKKLNGLKVRPYKVQAHDSWSSISRKNKVSVAYLLKVNNGIENLKPGQIINIPLEEGTLTREQTMVESEVSGVKTKEKEIPKESRYQEPVYHTVKKGETLFRISKNYAQSLENIKSWNGIKNNDLHVGQRLLVNYVYKYKKNVTDVASVNANLNAGTTSPKTENQSNQVVPVNSSKDVSKKEESFVSKNTKNENNLNSSRDKFTASPAKANPSETLTASSVKPASSIPVGRIVRQVQETGVASWIMDGESNLNKYYALHRSAPVGTIIRVTNRMNGKYVFVKVVGLLPDSGDNDNLIIKISQAASNKINVLDSRFQADLSYGLVE